MRILCLASIMFSASGCAAGYQDENKIEIACNVLENFVKREFQSADKPLFLDEQPIAPMPPDMYDDIERQVEWLRKNDPKGPSASELRSRLEEEEALFKMAPMERCPELARIRNEKSFIPADSEKPPETTDDGLFYTYDSLSIRMPWVDLERGEATFDAARVCGPLCAGGVLVRYRRGLDGVWRYEAEEGTWIS